MVRLPTPSSDGDWQSDASTIDLDLPPPSKSFMKKKKMKMGGLGLSLGKGKGKRVRRKVKAPTPLPPSPPPPPPRSLPPISLLTPLSSSTIPTLTPPPILCCDHAKEAYPSTRFPDHCHIPSEAITPLLINFIALARETAYGRTLEATDKLEPENRFLIVVQEVERTGPVMTTGVKERDMCAPRYFVPVVWEGDRDNQDHDMLNTDTEGEKAEMGKTFKTPFSVESHTAHTEHTLARSLIDIEDALDEERLASSPRTQTLTPVFARTHPWSDDPVEKGKEDRKVEWEAGEGGFREWFVTAREGNGEEAIGMKGSGNENEKLGGNLGVLWDWVPVKGRRGRMDVKCLECEREWVWMVRERGLTI
ncbi:hypothetical protein DL98DRAFT_576095 [Cadophora sp. DSE1049]|nr:hypothetical protein DL98DRAFT_576095 [Cadophora sp. DSE1049]